MIFVPPPAAADAIMEAADAGITVIVAITEGIPVLDMAQVKRFLDDEARRRGSSARTAPASSRPASARSASCPATSTSRAPVGVISRSGTLTYEAVWQLTALGLGQSTCVGIGGDPIIGTNQIDLLKLFQDDPETEAILMIGEIGGTAEEQAAAYVAKHVTKPVAAFIAGQTAPPGQRMGHAGAIISGGSGSAPGQDRGAARRPGIEVAPTPADLGTAVQKAMAKKK